MKWLSIPSFPPYEASDERQIRRGKRTMAQRSNGKGYLRITTSVQGIISHPYVHQLVCEAFRGPCPPGMETRHLDGNRQNNTADNLIWATKVVNEADKVWHGTLPWGEKVHGATLTLVMVAAARLRVDAGETITAVANEFGVRRGALSRAISGVRWARLPGAIPLRRKFRKLSDDEVADIRSTVAARRKTQIAIAAIRRP